MLNRSFGLLISRYRRAWGWTQTEMAQKLGVSQATVSKWENDELEPGLRTGLQLIKLLDVPMKRVVRALKRG